MINSAYSTPYNAPEAFDVIGDGHHYFDANIYSSISERGEVGN
jgi:hypothetical protein